MTAPRTRWPGGAPFAFSVFDDTDGMTSSNGRPIYDLLDRLGLRITKSVWPLAPERPVTVGGDSCGDPGYLAWVHELQARGHEVGYHHASDHSSRRDRTVEALDRFRDLFGHDPRVGADHAGNRESLYAGPRRLSGVRARAYASVQRRIQPDRPPFSGEDPSSPWFWGDLCRDRIRYWRGLTFATSDLTRVAAAPTYHDPARPYVGRWFISSDAPRRADLLRRLAPRRLDDLERRGGVCILYTHLGIDVVDGDRVHPDVRAALADVARRRPWSVPVSELLDHLAPGPIHVISDRERRRMEWRWLADRVRSGASVGPSQQTVDGGAGPWT